VIRFVRKHSFKIMTDWKKSGLTMPHWFVKAVVEVFNKKNPQHPSNFPTEGWPIYSKRYGRWITPRSFGYGLGMINNVFTLFNLALFEYSKRIGIFSEKDEMLSFNDDSIIGCQQEAYYRWLKVCQDSGGYLDSHKTFSAHGGMFCEIHQFKELKNNFKWVSAFHTMLHTLWKATNEDHFRHLVSTTWDSIRGWEHQITSEGMSLNQPIAEAIQSYMIKFGESYWQTQFIWDRPFMLGGCGFCNQRTLLQLKIDLVLIEQTPYPERFTLEKEMLVNKSSFDFKPVYRPWAEMPKGRTRQWMNQLGDLHGLNFELQSFKDRAKNKFVLDSEHYLDKFWSNFQKNRKKALSEPHFVDNWEAWCKEQRWSTYAVPSFLVEEEYTPPLNNDQLPFLRLVTEHNMYSMPSQVVSYIQSMKGETPTIPPDEISLEGFYTVDVPINKNADCYAPSLSFDNLSKLMDFCDPRRVLMDYWFRNSSVITKLFTKNFRAKTALQLLSNLFSDVSEDEFLGATWWTKIPAPYKEEWLPIIDKLLPDLVLPVLVELNSYGTAPDIPELAIYFDFVDAHRRENRAWWKSKIRSRHQSSRRKTLREEHPDIYFSKPDENNITTLIGMDQLAELLMQQYAELIAAYHSEGEPDLVEPLDETAAVDWAPTFDLLAGLKLTMDNDDTQEVENFDYLGGEPASDEDHQMADEDEIAAYEAELLAAYLDSGGSLVCEDEEDC
jgi:hypothetical protein